MKYSVRTWNSCCKSMSRVTLLYLSPLEIAGDCHHVSDRPSTTLETGWALAGSTLLLVQVLQICQTMSKRMTHLSTHPWITTLSKL